ncbi:MAG: hypothetical protein AAF236_02115 [Verrucomicrobiota bacterium]
MKKLSFIAALSGLALGAHAGEYSKAPLPLPDKTPIEECVDIGGSISGGYMTDFIFQGSRHARDTIWTDVNYTVDSFFVPITFGATYYNFLGATNQNAVFGDFLHTYASAGIGSFAGFDATLSYNHVFFPEGTGPVNATSQGVIILGVTRDLGFATAILGTSYSVAGDGSVFPDDFSGGWYHNAALQKGFDLTDSVSLVLEAGVGYSDDYWVHYWNSGWAHYYGKASLPIKLNCRATLTPYIGFNGGMDDNAFGFESSDSLDIFGNGAGGGDVLHGGISLSVSF